LRPTGSYNLPLHPTQALYECFSFCAFFGMATKIRPSKFAILQFIFGIFVDFQKIFGFSSKMT
jgi:hypothetical protein